MNKAMKIFVAICSVVIICSIGGISAAWEYAANLVNAQETSHYVKMEEFYYTENVPDDNEHELSHNALLQKVVSYDEGLNNPNSLLSKAVAQRFESYDNVSSNQQVSGGNLKNVFSSIDGFQYVGFLLVYINDSEYYIYTYDNRDTVELKVSVPTHLTHIHLNQGNWILSGGFEGTAISCVYDGKTNGPYKNTIDHKTYIRNNV